MAVSINGEAMRLYLVSGTVSNLRFSREAYSASKFQQFEETATEFAPLLLEAIGENGMAMSSAALNDPDRVRPEPAKGYWIEIEVVGRTLKGWFGSISIENGGHVDAVCDKNGLLMALHNPLARLIVFKPPCPEGLKPVFNRSLLYAYLAVSALLFFGEALVLAFAASTWGDFFELMPFLLATTASVAALFVLLAFRGELINGRRTRKILKLLGLSDTASKLTEEYIGTGYAYRY
ncbi:hypothetical protein BLA13014_05352 [Burkholderia aenigmatica]|uniref:Uncharacterized protein n=1 Tax=Burkholderia aenigmatica TaxID=2015348 RepID=A0A6P2Q7C3_9BURK|nr:MULTISPECIES: hypothetical protein [Burkholderia]VWC13812.1 hypothetical protein BLA13014_05352 [Burkholderia aenigmatica]